MKIRFTAEPEYFGRNKVTVEIFPQPVHEIYVCSWVNGDYWESHAVYDDIFTLLDMAWHDAVNLLQWIRHSQSPQMMPVVPIGVPGCTFLN